MDLGLPRMGGILLRMGESIYAQGVPALEGVNKTPPHYGGGTAKMAGGAPGLPKWQAEQISCQMQKKFWHSFCTSKRRAKQNNFSSNFFRLQLPISNV